MGEEKLKSVHVLLVEGKSGDAQLVWKMLADANTLEVNSNHFAVTTAASVRAALDQLALAAFDVILVDWGVDNPGLDTVRQLLSSQASVPLIVISEQADEALTRQVVQAGAQDYLVKNRLDSYWLVRAIRYAIERHHAENLAQRQLDYLGALRAIDLAINSSLDLRVTLTVFLEQVTTQLGVDAAQVLLFNRLRQSLEYAASRGWRGNPATSARKITGALAGQAVLERRIVTLNEGASNENLAKHFPGEGFRAYVAIPFIAKAQVKGVLEILHRAPLKPDAVWLDFAASLAQQVAIAIENANLLEELQHANMELSLAYDATIEGWARALDLRDHGAEGHTRRVTEVALALAQALGVSGSDLASIRRGALLHDIGKISIPDSILNKPGPLTDAEWVIVRRHPITAIELLSPIEYLRLALDIPYCHHEKWDGTGYPRGLAGEAIPFAARLFALADVWESLSSPRPYRAAWTPAQARDYIEAQAGKQFDPVITAAFLSLLQQTHSFASLFSAET